MSNPDLLYSKRDNGKIFLQEIFHAVLRKCEKQLLLFEKEESPYKQKRILVNSLYLSKLLLGRFLSLYRCYKSSKSHISTDVSKADIENIFQQTNMSMHTIYRTLKKKYSTFDTKMSSNVKFVDFRKPHISESRLFTLIQHDIPSDIKIDNIYERKLTFYNNQNLYNFTISFNGPKKVFLTDLHVKWPEQINKLQKKDLQILVAQCQKILDTSEQFLIDLNRYIRSFYFCGEFLRISKIIHKNELNFGYQTRSNGSSIAIFYLKSFSPRNVFKLITDDTNGVFFQSCRPICKPSLESDELDAKFLLYNMNELNDQEIYNILFQTHNIVHFSIIKSIFKRLLNFFSSSNIAILKISDDLQIIECHLFKSLAFKIGLDFITGVPVVLYCLISDLSQLLIRSLQCYEDECYQYLRAFCAYLFLYRLLIYPFVPHFKSLSNTSLMSIPFGKYVTFNFGNGCKIIYDDAGLVPTLRSFTEDSYLQSEKIIYFNSIYQKKIDLKSFDFFYPTVFNDLSNASILLELMNDLQKSGILVTLKQNELRFSIEPFGLVKFKIKSNYWQIQFFYPEISNYPNDLSIKIVGRFISSRFVPWLRFLIFRITTFMHALKQVKFVSGTSSVIRKVVMYNSLFFKIDFNSPTCLPISIKISGINLNHINSKNCEFYTISNPWSNLQITCSVYQSRLLKGYMNSLFENHEASYRFGPFLAGIINPLQKIHQIFLSDPKTQWIATSVQESFSFFLIYKRACTIITIIRSSQTFQLIIPHYGLSGILQFAIPSSKFERCKKNYNFAIQVSISQLAEVKESVEDFFHERSLIDYLEFGQPEYLTKQATPQIRFGGPIYCQNVYCILDENGIRITALDNAPKYLKNILTVSIEGRRNRCRFIKFIFNTLKLGPKGSDFLRTLSDITDMPGHLLKWQQSVETDDALNVNLNDKSIMMNLTTEFGRFYLVCYPDNDSVTISSDKGYQIEKVSTMSNMKSWFKKFVSDETTLSVDDNENDRTYF